MIRLVGLALMCSASAAVAEVPRVAVDIAPVHALVAQVMEGVGTPELIVPPGASPHSYALRPAQERSLSQADAVVWVGPGLTPWLGGPLDALAGAASQLVLMDVPQVLKLKLREGDGFSGRPQEEVGHEGAGYADHAEHFDHSLDPHAWLAPENAALWMLEISVVLGALDPDNALTYEANARKGAAGLAGLNGEINAVLAPVRGRPYMVYHDEYQYFERSFAMPAEGALSGEDALPVDTARAAEMRDMVRGAGVSCVMAGPQFDAGLSEVVGPTHVGVADPLGAELKPGPALYGDVLRGLATSLAACLQD
ncbi:zinc ABC transporter substrate-binding protein [Pseudosulfitobacter sp. DSM 107133]|uniref:zinc ABC transporter substrate-binding protein n=1 Tax=Pseudosulfitobacter sp. DSM 107133 TaxID=2883100 RepID=UPI000DF2E81D|nr:zinc ABC transporter substrate-binding protein [Pseudosulfitobacter sp. DSM 107133]UOA27796.1 High-affinity zinc uptake system protein ZnuA [Pseudosulfitobacter sp. DSM 107133]